jgi:DNA-binding NtrC family response regulator
MKLLIIEDEKITRISLTNTLQKEGYEVYSAKDGEEGLNIFNSILPGVVITDLRLPKLGGIEILNSVLKTLPTCKVILITAFATVDTAVIALKMGAYDYLTKPFSPEKLISILRNIGQLQSVINENLELRKQLSSLENRTIIGNSYSIKKMIETINQIASNDSTVLIEGESGTGKELVARALHQAGTRRNENFIAISCSSIPESLLESELFGYEKGAFTGAIKKHTGYFERANKGILFIDDIDDFPLTMQIKLLRVIQEREIVPIGSSQSIHIDVRIICATKVDLKKKVEQKLFREDLFYRLNIIPMKIPPLRERKDDIPVLVEHFFKKHNADDKIMLLTKEIYAKLISYDWPGNVRELENIVQRLIALSFAGKIDTDILDFSAQKKAGFSFPEAFHPFFSSAQPWALPEVLAQA